MTEFLQLMAAPFTACLILVGIHAYLGIHVLAREVIFVDLSLAQIAALGSAVAFLFEAGEESGWMTYAFALGFTFLGAAIFALTRTRKRRIPQEAIIGIVYAVASATAILVMDKSPHGTEHIKDLLVGSILWVTWSKVLWTAGLYALIGAFHWLFRERFLTISFSPEKAEQAGWNVRLWDFLFYGSFGFVVTSSVQIAGVLLVFCFLIVPTVTAALFAEHWKTRLALGWTAGTAVSVLGCGLSYAWDLPTGAAVVCAFGAVLLLAALVRKTVGRNPDVAPDRL